MRWLSAFFLDMLRGIATLKMFGRSREQVDTIRTISRQYGETTMEVLRTAFQTSLVLEWGGAVAVALVAVEVSLRLMAGAIAFERALAVLIIVPEFFLPLRQLATRYHAGAAGRAVAERAFAILDEPLPASAPRRGRVRRERLRPGRRPGWRATRPVDHLPGRHVHLPGPDRAGAPGPDLEIPAGRLTALVGVSGAGKSTIASLLLRFIEPDAGRILVGADLAAIDLGAWRARSPGCRSSRTCSMAASPTTSGWPGPTRPMPRSGRPPARRVRTTSSRPSRTATNRPSVRAGRG